jgi:hypothetical protein
VQVEVSTSWLKMARMAGRSSGWAKRMFGVFTGRHSGSRFQDTLPQCLAGRLSEQQEIARRADALFKLADQIEVKLVAAKQRVDPLTQAVPANRSNSPARRAPVSCSSPVLDYNKLLVW